MKKLFLSILCIIGLTCPGRAEDTARFNYFSYQGNDDYFNANPLSAPGEYFNPVIGGWASDPSICRTGDDYWLVTSTFGYFPGVPLYHSTDLISWEHVGNILSRQSQLSRLEGLSLDKGGIYAPDLKFNPADSTYYMITTCVMNGKDGGSLNFYVTAPHPLGPWSEPKVIEGMEGIDPSFFFDDDGRTYIIYKSDEHNPVKWSNYRALSIGEFDTVSGRFVGEPRHFKEEGVGPEEHLERNEGPHIFKKDGKYYMIAAEGGTNWVHSEVCYRADSVFGPYRRWSRNPMLTQRLLKPARSFPVTSTGHVDMVQRPSGDWVAVFLGCRPWNGGEDQLGRETYMMPVKWSADGFPYITQCLDTVPSKSILPGSAAPQRAGQTGNFTWRDDFNSPVIRQEWLGLWGDPSIYATVGDGLQLACAPVDARSRVTPAFLGHRIQHHKFIAETLVDFTPGSESASAGLLIVKNETRQYYLAVERDRVALYRLGKPGRNELLASAPLNHKSPVTLQAECQGATYEFRYHTAGDGWKLLAAGVPAEHVATQRGGFTGTVIGPFATSLKL